MPVKQKIDQIENFNYIRDALYWDAQQTIGDAVQAVLDDGIFPLYHTEDDRGLDKQEYVEFFAEVLSKLAK